MPWKSKWKRPRPSQLDKDLEPAILVPAHHSYPSGHATQASLTAEALKHVMPNHLNKVWPHIDHVANEIAANREWAGVHYKSDTDAGKQLGKDIWEKVKNIPLFKDSLLLSAKEEWN